MKALDWLPAQADPGFPNAAFAGFPAGDTAMAGLAADADLAAFLANRNGLYAFARALHIFGSDPARPFHDLAARNRGAWREAYGPAAAGLLFFAEDAFGHLFALRNGVAVSFDPETARMEQLGQGFRGWADYLVGDLSFATGGGVAQAWSQSNGPLPFEERLSPIKPFLLGGEFALANLRPLPWEQCLGLKAEVYRKTKDLPEGATVEIRP